MRHFLPLCQSNLSDAAKLELLDVLFAAHAKAAQTNQNLSSVAVKLSAAGSGDFGKAITAAVSMLGAKHGPITEARRAIYDWMDQELSGFVFAGKAVPGFGHSFAKDSVSPEFQGLHAYIVTVYSDHAKRLDRVTDAIQSIRGKRVYPNAAGLTAVCADLLGIPYGVESALFVAARLPVWAGIFAST